MAAGKNKDDVIKFENPFGEEGSGSDDDEKQEEEAAPTEVTVKPAAVGESATPRKSSSLDASNTLVLPDQVNERDRRRRMDNDQMQALGLISPNSAFRKRWDVAQIIMLIYVAIGIPFRMGFDVDVVLWSFPFFWIDVVVDIYFIIDVYVTFKSAYYDKHGELVTDPAMIRRQYVWTRPYWFIIDSSACFPVAYIEWVVQALDEGHVGENANTSSTNKALKMLRLLRLLKLLRLLRLNRLMARYEEELYSIMTTMKFGKILVIMFIVGHWLACLWYGSGSQHGEDAPEGTCGVDLQGKELDCTGWVDRRWGDGAAARDDNSTAGLTSNFDRYVSSVYWSVMTMTTVGYGDIVPQTALELGMAIVGMVTGGFIFGMIVGSLAELSKRSNAAELMRTKYLEKVTAFLNVGAGRKVPRDLQRSVRSYYSNYYNHRRAGNELYNFLVQMPRHMRDDVASQLHWIDDGEGIKGILYKMPWCTRLDTLSQITICARMNIVTVQPVVVHRDGSRSNLIMEQGRVGRTMFLVVDGSDIIVEEDGKSVDVLGTGTFTDSNGKPLDGHCRTRTVYAAKDEVIVGELTYEAMQALRRERPEISKELVPYANQLAQTLNASGKAPNAMVTELDCYPELEVLESALSKKLEQVDERMARIEELLLRK